MKKMTPVLTVSSIEDSLTFWSDRLGFEKTVEVPHGDSLGFAILVKGSIEVMLQSHDSLAADAPQLLEEAKSSHAYLFVEVPDIEAAARAVDGLEIVLPRRETFYGATEIGVREPGGHVVVFAELSEQPQE